MFLPKAIGLLMNEVELRPLQEFEKHLSLVQENTNADGFVYPPTMHRVQISGLDLSPEECVVPRTERPAQLFRLPASHDLSISGKLAEDDFRTGDGGFMMHLIGYLYGARLQFHDWWFTNKVPITPTHNIQLSDTTACRFLSISYSTWKTWRPKQRKLMTNILYMNSRSPSYEWDWEQFMMDYLVTDACYNLASITHGVNAKGHSRRIQALCDRFCIPLDGRITSLMVRLRNGLFHESLWDGSQPCTAIRLDAVRVVFVLRKFNQRLIPALLGFETRYIHTNPEIIGTLAFD